ncbi:MAG: sulfotransferase [Candidatus Thermoplasmatota archaeon]|nr:sulfotransferase [Candidatus Thermoplasmatota archaeon]
MQKNPVIIIGMHRSGTSLVTKLLNKLGVFIGAYLDDNQESIFFYRLNEWMLRQLNTTWDNPYNFRFLNDTLIREFLRVINLHMNNFCTRKIYLGYRNAFKFKNFSDISFNWGWKDPRNTFTLDVWKLVFPNLKVIHVYRNPIDVAQSMRIREIEKRRNTDSGNLKTLKNFIKEVTTYGTVGYQISPRVDEINEGIKLWKCYMEKAFSYENQFKGRIIHIKYEDLLDDPFSKLDQICDFINLCLDFKAIDRNIDFIDKNRKYAFIRDENLLKIYNNIKNDKFLKKYKYNSILEEL